MKQSVIKQTAQEKKLVPFSVQAKLNTRTKKNCKVRIQDLIVPSVTKWLRGFYDADFVITDSFHGCVFSIIFNKPFIVLMNQKRGLSRFYSLLRTFELLNENSLVPHSFNSKNTDSIILKEKKQSLLFLKNKLE